MPSRLSLLNVQRALSRLAEAYKPLGPRNEMANVWIDVLADLEPEELERAVLRYMRSDSKWHPAPGQLLALANSARGTGSTQNPRSAIAQSSHQQLTSLYHAWEQTHEGPCPVCGARLEALSPEVRGWKAVDMTPDGFTPPSSFGILHRVDRHEGAQIPFIGEAFQ